MWEAMRGAFICSVCSSQILCPLARLFEQYETWRNRASYRKVLALEYGHDRKDYEGHSLQNMGLVGK